MDSTAPEDVQDVDNPVQDQGMDPTAELDFQMTELDFPKVLSLGRAVTASPALVILWRLAWLLLARV